MLIKRKTQQKLLNITLQVRLQPIMQLLTKFILVIITTIIIRTTMVLITLITIQELSTITIIMGTSHIIHIICRLERTMRIVDLKDLRLAKTTYWV